jgi:hypothetical protein
MEFCRVVVTQNETVFKSLAVYEKRKRSQSFHTAVGRMVWNTYLKTPGHSTQDLII